MEYGQVVRLQEVDLYNAIYIRQAKMLIESICQDFEKDGYEVQPFIIPSASIEAPHKRDRVWIIAYSDSNGRKRNKKHEEGQQYGKGGPTRCKFDSFEGSKSTSDPNRPEVQGSDNRNTS